MTFASEVLQVAVVGPSDTTEYKNLAIEVMNKWNIENTRQRKVVLLPWSSEFAISDSGQHPQQLLNRQGIDNADVTVAIFKSRFGSPTENYQSGTEEEITRSLQQGKTVHLFFFEGQASVDDSDEALLQRKRLREFRETIRSKVYYEQFQDANDFERKLGKAIERDTWALGKKASEDRLNSTRGFTQDRRIKFRVDSKEDDHLVPTRRGSKIQHHHWIEVTNTSDYDASEVTFLRPEDSAMYYFRDNNGPVELKSQQTWKVRFIKVMDDKQLKITIRWKDAGKMHEETFNIQ